MMLRAHSPAAQEDDRPEIFAPVADLMVSVVFIFMLLALGLALQADRVGTVPRSDYERVAGELAEARQLAASRGADLARLASVVRYMRDENLVPVLDRVARTDQTRAEILQQVGSRLGSLGVEVAVNQQDGTLSLPASLLFASGRSEPSVQGSQVITALGRALAAVLPCYTGAAPEGAACPQHESGPGLTAVYIEGHTDVTPFGSPNGRFRNNWDLSAGRAIEAFSLLRASSDGLDGLRNASGQALLGVSGYADTRPAAEGADRTSPAAMERDRRIELRFLMANESERAGTALKALRERLDGVAELTR